MVTINILSVLRECNRESLIQRSIPMGTGLGLLAYYCVKQGYLSGSTRFGAGPKVLLGATIGYFAGKISYQQKCAEKLMRLPNSRLAEMLRYSEILFKKDFRKKYRPLSLLCQAKHLHGFAHSKKGFVRNFEPLPQSLDVLHEWP